MAFKSALSFAVLLSALVGFAVPAFATTGAPAPAPGLTGLALAKSKNCLACHAVSSKLVGPAFTAVASKYAKNKDAEKALTEKVLKGGSGVWGAIPMPANGQVTEVEAKQLVQWILTSPS